MTDAPGAAEQTGRKAFLVEMDMWSFSAGSSSRARRLSALKGRVGTVQLSLLPSAVVG
jgi:hypothetical protein